MGSWLILLVSHLPENWNLAVMSVVVSVVASVLDSIVFRGSPWFHRKPDTWWKVFRFSVAVAWGYSGTGTAAIESLPCNCYEGSHNPGRDESLWAGHGAVTTTENQHPARCAFWRFLCFRHTEMSPAHFCSLECPFPAIPLGTSISPGRWAPYPHDRRACSRRPSP